HSGLYYKPVSAKAKTCVTGARGMVEFCLKHAIPHQICGKLVVAVSEDELPRLAELLRRGQANGVPGVSAIGPERIREIEPHAAGVRALWAPGTGIVDYTAVARKYAELIQAAGGEVRYRAKVTGLRTLADGETLVLTTTGEVRTKQLVNCAGLHSDRVARLGGARPEARIVPFR